MMRCYTTGVSRSLEEYADRIEHALLHTRCCWEHGRWPGSCNGQPVRFTLRVQHSEVTDGGFEGFVVARVAIQDMLLSLSERERDIVGGYAYVGATGPYPQEAWARYAYGVNLSAKKLKDFARAIVRRMAQGSTVRRPVKR